MSAANRGGELPPGLTSRLDSVCDRFELQWRVGPAPRLEEFLSLAGEAERPALLRELLELDVHYRVHRGNGVTPGPEEYCRRLPEHVDFVVAFFASSHAGLVLHGFEILGELGRGGMGIVYKARDRLRGGLAALKILPRVEASALYRFKQEFRSLADLCHPNLVTLHELHSEGPTWFFTMEYVEGVPLLAYVRPHPRSTVPSPTVDESVQTVLSEALAGAVGPAETFHLPSVDLERLRPTFRQLTEGLLALHAAGKLHRDLKPSNVLVSRTGRVVILDFGLAVELDPAGYHHSQASGIVGTVAYMAPEQAACRPISPASDWYSVGVMLYEALTGQLPFHGNVNQMLQAKRDHAPPSPGQVLPGIPEDLDSLCTELLSRNPQTRPSGHEVLSRLGHPVSRPTPARHLPFVGRDRHLLSLHEAFEDIKHGRTTFLLVHGASGTGKSTLVQRFLDHLAANGEAVVLAGRCYEQEFVPYKALDGLVDALSLYLGRLSLLEVQALLPRAVSHLARVFPVLRRVEAIARAPGRDPESTDPQEAHRRASQALRELLARLGDRLPLVLFIDDLQWGDFDSARLLRELLQPPDPPVLLLLGCYRSEDASSSPFLRSWCQPDVVGPALTCRTLSVEALTLAESEELALELLDRSKRDSQARAEVIARESGGNPYFVHELVQQAKSGAEAEQTVQGPVTLEKVIRTRILQLPEEARRLLEVVAVAGRPLLEADACAAAGSSDRVALATLRSGRLIRAQQEQIDTYHDRIRETILGKLSVADRTNYHRLLVETLEVRETPDPERLAFHYHGAGQIERARQSYAAAGDQAADALAFDHSARLYRQALQLAARGGQGEHQLRVRLGDALANAGRGAEAAQAYLAAASSARPAALELHRRAALQFLVSGHVDEGIRTLHPVLAAVGMRLATTPKRALLSLLWHRAQLRLRGVGFRERAPSQTRAEDLERIDICWSVTIGLATIDPIRSAAFQARGLLLALKTGDSFRITRALALESAHLAATGSAGGRRRARKLLTLADKLACRTVHPHARARVTLTRGTTSYLEGSWRAGLDYCDQAERMLREECVGVFRETHTAQVFSLSCLNYLGEVAELSRRWPGLVREAQDRGDLFALVNLKTFNMALVRLAADEPEEARRELNEAIGKWSQQGYHVQHHHALTARVQIDLYQADARSAWEQVSRAWPVFWRSLLGRVQLLRVQMLQMRAYSALAGLRSAADLKDLLRTIERDAQSLQRERLVWPAAIACFLRAGIAAGHGDAVGSRRLLAEAAAAFDTAEMFLFAEATRRRLGELTGGAVGQALISQANAWMARQHILNPGRMTAVYAPGFPDADPSPPSSPVRSLQASLLMQSPVTSVSPRAEVALDDIVVS